MAEYLTWTLISLPILAWIYWKLSQTYSFWSSRGVPGPKPLFILGNMHQMFKQNRGLHDLSLVRQFGKMYGYFAGRSPVLMVADAELIKTILVKDFQHFINRQPQKMYHEIWSQNMFFAEDEQWRRQRSITSPAFTSGKLKSMHGMIEKCINNLVQHFDGIVEQKGGRIENIKEKLAGFTIDVIGSTSFGLEVNCNASEAEEGKSPFVVNGQKLFWVNPIRGLTIILSPKWLLKLLQIKMFFNPTTFEWFVNLSREIVKKRKASGIKRNDFVQLLLDASIDEAVLEKTSFDQLTADAEKDDEHSNTTKTSHSTSHTVRSLSDDETIAQMIVFFSAGFDTTATTLTHAIFELQRNPFIQERLFEEIQRATEELTDETSMEYFDCVVNGIPYLEATMKEVLRMYPPVTILFRRVNSDSYTLNGVKLPKDAQIEISSYAVHHMAEYYPEPERFNPERFLPENKPKLTPYTFLPFGQGPRNCVGMRFAYQEIKLCLARIVRLYRFEPTVDTPEKLTFKKGSPLLNTLGFPCKISKRN